MKTAIIAASIALVGMSSAHAQVTFFQKPPSAAELRQALMGGAAPQTVAPARPQAIAPARPAGVRTRGIVWSGGGNTPVQKPAPAPAVQSAAAPVTAPVYSNPQQQAQSYQQKQASAAGPAAGMPITFSSGSSRLAAGSIGFIQTVAEMLSGDPSLRLLIEGHTDSVGSYKRNMVLSWERAMGVYRVLVEQYGIDPARLQPSGLGPTEPMPGLAPNDGNNRRVQFRLMG
ncbi:MAG: OmpA family protein [Burkholderiaceae bacterium]